jgi:hypothetical protein
MWPRSVAGPRTPDLKPRFARGEHVEPIPMLTVMGPLGYRRPELLELITLRKSLNKRLTLLDPQEIPAAKYSGGPFGKRD